MAVWVLVQFLECHAVSIRCQKSLISKELRLRFWGKPPLICYDILFGVIRVVAPSYAPSYNICWTRLGLGMAWSCRSSTCGHMSHHRPVMYWSANTTRNRGTVAMG